MPMWNMNGKGPTRGPFSVSAMQSWLEGGREHCGLAVLDHRLRGEVVVAADRGSAVAAEDCAEFVDVRASGARDGGRMRCGRRGGVSEDLAGNIDCLSRVVLADAEGHEEALDESEDGGDTRPKEEEIDNAGCVSAKVEMVGTKAAEEEREQEPDHLIFASTFVLGVEPRALLVVHIDGVDGVGGIHGIVPRG